MALKITRPDKRDGTEVLGGALVTFDNGVAHLTGYVSQLRPSVAAALRRRGYRAENVRHTTPPAAPPAEQTPAEQTPAPSTPPAEDTGDQTPEEPATAGEPVVADADSPAGQ